MKKYEGEDINNRTSENLTLVTSYYELNNFEKRPKGRNRENYYKWAELIFGLDKNIVFFVGEEQDNLHIWKKRQQYGFLNKTLIIFKKFQDIPFFNLKDEIKEYIEENTPNNITEKETNYFAITTWSKIFFMDEILKKNPFNTDYFGWIDFGIYHVTKNNIPDDLENILVPNTDKIKILERIWTTKNEMKDHKEYAKMLRCKMGGGFWISEKSYMLEFVFLFKKYLFYLLSERLIIQEEGIFGMIYHYNKNLFSTYLGNYYNIFENVKEYRSFDFIMLYNLDYCAENESYEHAFNICLILFEKFLDQMDKEEIFHVYDQFTLISFYIDKEKGKHGLNEWFKLIKNDYEYYNMFQENKDRILDNIIHFDDNEIYEKFKSLIKIIEK